MVLTIYKINSEIPEMASFYKVTICFQIPWKKQKTPHNISLETQTLLYDIVLVYTTKVTMDGAW